MKKILIFSLLSVIFLNSGCSDEDKKIADDIINKEKETALKDEQERKKITTFTAVDDGQKFTQFGQETEDTKKPENKKPEKRQNNKTTNFKMFGS